MRISSDDSRILSWPWEALRDSQATVLGQICPIERKLNIITDSKIDALNLPKDIINVLLVTARPYEDDVRFRSISRLLIELVEERNLPVNIHLLRPPTFKELESHLDKHPNFYHVLHFDGHGAFGALISDEADEEQSEYQPEHPELVYSFKGVEGFLVFEDKDGEPDLINAEKISTILMDKTIPIVVLNACQSAMQRKNENDPFADVATSIMKCGIHSVVAMAYSLYVRGAQEFLPAFYDKLFNGSDIAVATLAGRKNMLINDKRISPRGEFHLKDWIVPVLYQQKSTAFAFAEKAKQTVKRESKISGEASDKENPYGFIGRDGAILRLERALRRDTPGILIHGLGGIGKTTLARGFLKWLEDTGGLGNGLFWFTFQEIRTAEAVINQMGEPLFGANFRLAPMEKRIEVLAQTFRENKFIIVWDNFESVKGIEETEVKPVLSEADSKLLFAFLRKLRGGETKIIITSRSDEEWLGIQRAKIDIGGLDGEERWEFCEKILRELGLKFDRNAPGLVEIMNLLAGHPLSMRVILPMMEKQSADEILRTLKSNIAGFASEDEANQKLFAALRFAEEGIPPDLKQLLIPLGLHEKFVVSSDLEWMAEENEAGFSKEQIDRFIKILSTAGLLHHRGHNIYEMHPALTGFLRCAVLKEEKPETVEKWTGAFVELMGTLADAYTPKKLHEKRGIVMIHSVNFHFAMKEAERLGINDYYGAILQFQAQYANHIRDFDTAEEFFEKYALLSISIGREDNAAAAYHQLGMIAEEHRNFQTAEKWYMKSLEIRERLKDEHGAAITYHQLGMIAEEQRVFEAAEKWYLKEKEITERIGDELGSSSSKYYGFYHSYL